MVQHAMQCCHREGLCACVYASVTCSIIAKAAAQKHNPCVCGAVVQVQPGQSVALVGSSGGGKSTVVKVRGLTHH